MFRAPACSKGNFLAMAVNNSLTFSAVFAEVSKNRSPASLAYASASEVVIARLSGCSATRSALFPARAMIIFSLACLCSSLTQAFALSNEDCRVVSLDQILDKSISYCLCDIVDNDCAVGISIIHRRKRLVSFLACGIPYLEFHCGGLVKGDGLRKEGGPNRGFSVVIELIL